MITVLTVVQKCSTLA